MPNPRSDSDLSHMLERLDFDDPFHIVHPSHRHACTDLGRPLTEYETRSRVESILSRNRRICSFKGGGVYDHYVPAHVAEIVGRNEFYTSYTPYQPEVSQGLLQTLFEYQSMMAEIVGLPVVNASMYDWSTALGESALMCNRVTGRMDMLVPDSLSPQRRQVLSTYASSARITVRYVPVDDATGQMRAESVGELISDDTAGVYLENPNYYGIFEEEAPDIVELAHKHGARAVVGVDPLACGVINPPGAYGADIVVGEAAHLGNPVNFGGPLLGVFAVKDDRALLRTTPGRLIGLTEDADGVPGYVMTLQTREQHIRRQRATSNICTNEALCAVACAAYLASLGKRGFVELARALMANAAYAATAIDAVDGFDAPVHTGMHFREFVVRSRIPWNEVEGHLNENGITGGIPIDDDRSLFCITDKHTKDDIDLLCSVLGAI